MRRPWCLLRAVSFVLVGGVQLLEVHGPDGQTAWVNPHEISALRAPNATDLHRYFPRGTKCVISTTNGKFIAAIESCGQLRDRLDARP